VNSYFVHKRERRISFIMYRFLLLGIVLIGAHGDDDGDDRTRWPLIFAAGEGNGQEVERLLASGADVGEKSKDGETALHVAAIRGDLRTLTALLAAGAEVDARTPPGSTIFMTPTMWATYHGHTQFVQRLLEAGADPTAADENGKTLLTMTQEAGQPEIESLVRKYYALRVQREPS
jgi:ankyrin repeat protein